MTQLSTINLNDTDYELKQKAVRNAYKLYDSQGQEVMKTKQKLLKAKEDFPFTDPEGKEIFRVKAQNILDIAGDYAIIDSETEEQVAILKKDFTLLSQSWKIKDSDGQLIAHITNRGKIIGLLRTITDLANLIPNKYTVENPEGRQIGSMNGQLSIRDHYRIYVEKNAPDREIIVSSCAVIDALDNT